DDVQYLALAGIIRSEQVTGTDLNAKHLLGGDAGERDVERFGLGARARSVDHDIARGPGEAAHVDLALVGLGRAEIERETRDSLGDVERGTRCELGKIGRLIDGRAAIRRRRSRLTA